MLTEKEIEALEVVVRTLGDCWYRDMLQGLLQRDAATRLAERLPVETVSILENVKEYCEDEAIYDKLASYGDFYYKIVALLKKEKA